MKNSLTDKQKKFVEEYMIDLNASGAARRSGYSEANSDKIGSELLGKTRVQKAIQEKMEARSQKLEITAEAVVRELAAIGFADIQGFFEFRNDQIAIRKDIFTNPQRSKAIRGVSIGTSGVSLFFHDRLKALDLLLRHISLNPNHIDADKESMSDRISRMMKLYIQRKKDEEGKKIKEEQRKKEENL